MDTITFTDRFAYATGIKSVKGETISECLDFVEVPFMAHDVESITLGDITIPAGFMQMCES